jgi:hypothetical protein
MQTSSGTVTEDYGVVNVLTRLLTFLAVFAAVATAVAAVPPEYDLSGRTVSAGEDAEFMPGQSGLRRASGQTTVRRNGMPPSSYRNRTAAYHKQLPADDPEPSPDSFSAEPARPADPVRPSAPTERMEPVAAPEPMAYEDESSYVDEANWQGDYWNHYHEPPAPTCNSGTWFNRGRWYARQDFVYMSRYSTDTRSLIGDFTTFNSQTGVPTELTTTGRSLGFEPGGKITLGRFLCRDQKNRDHSLEFAFFGLFDWQQSNGMTSRGENELFTLIDPYRDPFENAGPQVGGFNAAQEQNFTYDSSFDSYEMNYVIAQRLGRDRLELSPEGEWVRKLSGSHTSTFLGGVRYISIGEGFDWRSGASDPTEANGLYQVTTNNQMVGLQFGHELMFQRPKFRFGMRNKVGGYINYADQNTFVNIVDTREDVETTGSQTRVESGSSHDMAFIYDLSIMAAYHIRPNIAIRTGYEFMFINQLALAPEQLTFVPPPDSRIVTGGALLYNGFSIGLEMVW